MTKKVVKGILAGLLTAVFGGFGSVASCQDLNPLEMPTVNEDSVMKHIVELSSERYAGRLAGSNGYNEALYYAEQVLRTYGATLDRQVFEIECNEIENCKFNTYTPGTKEKTVYTLGNEFCCAGMTGRGYVDAQMVFCGYGIDNELMNEYKSVDVRGKIAIVLSGLPEGGWIPQDIAARYRLLRDKARTAEKHGAIGMLVINTSNSCRSDEPQSRIYCGDMPHLSTFPILHLTLDCGRQLLQGEAMTLDTAISRINWLHQANSFTLLKKAEIDVNASYSPRALTANLVATLKGSDKRLAKEYIVIAASLDHAGMQGETCLFPGADINASGVAAVLETARLLSQPEYRPRRSVLFVLFSGSEQLYLGSRIFVSAFPKLKKIEAFVNLQNIGSGDSILLLGGNRYPSLWNLAKSHDEREEVSVEHSAALDLRGDARAFDFNGIPSLVITTLNGLHHNHVSSDIWENIDRRTLVVATQLAAETVRELADGFYQGRSIRTRIH